MGVCSNKMNLISFNKKFGDARWEVCLKNLQKRNVVENCKSIFQ